MSQHRPFINCSGQAMVEYLVATSIVLSLFFLPFNGSDALIVIFADAIQQGYARFFSAVALPI